LVNGNQYICSSDNLRRRFSEYFKISYLKVHKDMPICCALLIHGYSNFSLEILGYYDSSELLTREKDYIKQLKPKYNIIQDPTDPPMTGRKHSPESLAKLSGENHYMFGKTHNLETKDKISASMKGIRLSEEHKKKCH
jgi:group I intron endonuclease